MTGPGVGSPAGFALGALVVAVLVALIPAARVTRRGVAAGLRAE